MNVVQQILRSIVISLAAVNQADLLRLAHLLQSAGANPDLEEEARLMLLDLAHGLEVLGRSGRQPH